VDVHLREEVKKIVTTEMESSKMVKGCKRALPYLEKGKYGGNRNFASVGEMSEVAFFLVALL